MSWFSRYIRSSIGMKQAMGITGLILLGYVVAHLIGNLQIFAGRYALNEYAVGLREFGPLLWLARAGLLAAVLIHIGAALRLVQINKAARPVRYQVFKPQTTPFYARTMTWTGLIVFAFVVYHLLHFTFGAVLHDYYALTDPQGRHDVHAMVVLGFQEIPVAVSYVVAVGLLCLHLAHGIPSLFQSLGLRHPKYTPLIITVGHWLAVLLFLGYTAIPVAVLAGWVQASGA